MADVIKIKRGLSTNFGSATLQDGELALVTDTSKVWIGNGGNKFCINPTITKNDVGLGNVTNESKTTMFTSPTFTGTPTAPTPPLGDNTKNIATEFIKRSIDNLVNASPTTLDTLKELADALGDDPNFATTMTTQLGLKASIDSPTFTGTPKAPTPQVTDNSTNISTTAWVKSQNYITSDSNITIDGGTF
jgi:hypothetical protein